MAEVAALRDRAGRRVSGKKQNLKVVLPSYHKTVTVSSEAERDLLLKADRLRGSIERTQQQRAGAG